MHNCIQTYTFNNKLFENNLHKNVLNCCTCLICNSTCICYNMQVSLLLKKKDFFLYG